MCTPLWLGFALKYVTPHECYWPHCLLVSGIIINQRPDHVALLGLMPKIVDECYAVLQDLKNTGVATVLVEQNTERALKAADQVLVIEAGNPTWQGEAAELAQNPDKIEALLSGSTM